ncbi:9484_t:CDS:1, partial [Gigaspora rosea]
VARLTKKKLNFSWTPKLLKKYAETGNDSNWQHINWHNNPD